MCSDSSSLAEPFFFSFFPLNSLPFSHTGLLAVPYTCLANSHFRAFWVAVTFAWKSKYSLYRCQLINKTCPQHLILYCTLNTSCSPDPPYPVFSFFFLIQHTLFFLCLWISSFYFIFSGHAMWHVGAGSQHRRSHPWQVRAEETWQARRIKTRGAPWTCSSIYS